MIPLQVKALQFNVWLDATRVHGGIGLVADAIIESDADIVSLIEVKNIGGNFVTKLKKELNNRGETYYGDFCGNALKMSMDADTAILSRFPIREERVVYRTMENCIVRSLIDVSSGDQIHTIAVYSVHLEYRNYSCYLPRGYHSCSHWFPGWKMVGQNWLCWLYDSTIGLCTAKRMTNSISPVTDPEVIRRDNLASGRPDAIHRLLDDAGPLIEREIPVIVMGDFNEPSTYDWTEATAQMADHNGLVYNWDSTELLKQGGFIDSYRHVYPNPRTHPGFTWPTAAQGSNQKEPKKTDWAKRADERDRIDFIFVKGDQLKIQDASLVGTPLSVVRDEFVDESALFQDRWSHKVNSPWPSDHRAVLTVLEVDSQGLHSLPN